MIKSLKIFLSVLALISIGFSLAFYFEWGPFTKKGIKTLENNLTNQTSNEDRSIALPAQINDSVDCLILDKENCALGKPIYENNQLAAIGFNIPKDGAVYTPFKGKYEGDTSLVLNGVGYPSIELMDITKDDWGFSQTRSYFSVVSFPQGSITTETVEAKQTIVVLTETGKIQGDYNLILTFKQYNNETGEWKTDLDLLKQYFPYLQNK